ncbi:MAG: zinc ribbon domain-containing protein [Pirellulaceae bacterium]|nr:zinc ribbon domain-containing protein [Pirellulaceae bacterium]
MPTYDYQCDACGHELEIFQPITESPKRKCPSCGRQKLRRLLGSGAAVVFKGSGFYQTDYRSESYKKRAAADKPAGDAASSGSSNDAAASGSSNDAGKASKSKPTGKVSTEK